MTDKFLAAIISSVDQIPYVQQLRRGSPEGSGMGGESKAVLNGGRQEGKLGWGAWGLAGGRKGKRLETCAGL